MFLLHCRVFTSSLNFQMDLVLTWISIYWFSRAGPAASARIYFEVGKTIRAISEPLIDSVPMGVSIFPRELVVVPKA